jgi:hypothetical protein
MQWQWQAALQRLPSPNPRSAALRQRLQLGGSEVIIS